MTPLLEHTRHVQVRQAAKAKLQTSFSAGTVDLPGLMRALSTANYRGVVCVEYLRTTQDLHGMMPVEVIRETVKLRDAMRTTRK
jgi:hydroxypyruvate isomerase